MSEVLDNKSRLPVFAPDEILEELTGYKLPYKQIQWLNMKNYPFEVNAANHPKVLMEVVLHRLGSPSAKPAEVVEKTKWKPDFNKIAQGNTT